MVPAVDILGSGIAACCSAKLLQRAAFSLQLDKKPRPKLPAILMSQSTRNLLSDVFDDAELFSDWHPIDKRIVAWGPQADAVVLPHRALAVSETVLLDRLWSNIAEPDAAGETTWKIVSTFQGSKAGGEDHHFGSRVASANAVRLRDGVDQHACWVESAANGWLFLLASGEQNGTLITVGDAPAMLLERSRLIAQQIDSLSEHVSQFPAYPRILYPLCGPGWLACGTAAMSFDPVCGEGAGNAVREAILGCAAIRASIGGGNVAAILHHYSSRLIGGMLRHMELCSQFYRAARCGPWWDEELALLDEGLKWARAQANAAFRPHYRLVGFELEALVS